MVNTSIDIQENLAATEQPSRAHVVLYPARPGLVARLSANETASFRCGLSKT